MKKFFCIVIALIMALGAVPAFATNSVVIDKGNITDYVTMTEVLNLQNVEIVDILDSETKNILIVKDKEGNYSYSSSNNGIDFTSTDLSSQLGSILNINMSDVIDFKITNIQEINNQVIVHGWYSVIGTRNYLEYDGTPASYETEISKNFVLKTSDGITFTNMNMPDLNTLWCESYIYECNGKYIYCTERQLAVEVSKADDWHSNCEGFYYISDNLTDWTACKTPKFFVWSYSTEEHVTTVKYKVSKNSLAVIASYTTAEGGIGSYFPLLCCTSDFENYTVIDTEFIEKGFIEAFLTTDINTLIICVGIVYWDNFEYYGTLRDMEIYTLDMTNGKIEKVISEHNDNGVLYHIITKSGYERAIFYADNNDGSVHYSNDGYKTITTINLGNGDKNYLYINTDYNCSYENYTIGTCEKNKNKLCIIKDDFSEVYALNFENIEASFIAGNMLYIIADGKYYAVSAKTLIDSLNNEKEEKVSVQSIKIANEPNNTSYTYMSENRLELSGLSIEVTYTDGTKELITDTSLLTVSELDTSELGTQEIIVEYRGCTDTFEVEVSNSFWQFVMPYIIKMIEIIISAINQLSTILA